MKRTIVFLILAILVSSVLEAQTIRGRIIYPNGAAYAGATAVAVDASNRKTTGVHGSRRMVLHSSRPPRQLPSHGADAARDAKHRSHGDRGGVRRHGAAANAVSYDPPPR
ncbi:MAG TPA: hypothetical protein VEO74_19345 [Thermoanaerobaculia bacterium]|nr:hypothetical protein [Thermoanaerobaculia bacterium]